MADSENAGSFVLNTCTICYPAPFTSLPPTHRHPKSLEPCRYAPEHLIINTEDAQDWVADIENAGSVFLGPWAPVTVGDYASGTNHTLPTYGYANMYSGVSLDSFQKHITIQHLTRQVSAHPFEPEIPMMGRGGDCRSIAGVLPEVRHQ